MQEKNTDAKIKFKHKIEITDYYVMLSLHKALLEAKFHQNPDNIEVAFSPMVADFCNELLDKLAQMDAAKDAEKMRKLEKSGSGVVCDTVSETGTWSGWRKLENQPFYRERAVENALLNNRWGKMSAEEKRKATRNLISPFQATEAEIECLIQEVDGKYPVRANV